MIFSAFKLKYFIKYSRIFIIPHKLLVFVLVEVRSFFFLLEKMDDEYFKKRFRGFGFGNFGPNGPFDGNHNQNDHFDAFFHHDINHMFREMEDMMKHFGFANIDFNQSNIRI